MKLLTLILFLTQFLSNLPIVELDLEAKAFREAFNRRDDHARVVMVFSPT